MTGDRCEDLEDFLRRGAQAEVLEDDRPTDAVEVTRRLDRPAALANDDNRNERQEIEIVQASHRSYGDLAGLDIRQNDRPCSLGDLRHRQYDQQRSPESHVFAWHLHTSLVQVA